MNGKKGVFPSNFVKIVEGESILTIVIRFVVIKEMHDMIPFVVAIRVSVYQEVGHVRLCRTTSARFESK